MRFREKSATLKTPEKPAADDTEAQARFAEESRRYESRAGAVQEKVNDAYLRAQGQEGVTSYGRMVDLLLAERRARR